MSRYLGRSVLVRVVRLQFSLRCFIPSPPLPSIITPPYHLSLSFCYVFVQIIVATDVAARGLDIPGVDIVFHYRLPNEMVPGEIAFVFRPAIRSHASVECILCRVCSDRIGVNVVP